MRLPLRAPPLDGVDFLRDASERAEHHSHKALLANLIFDSADHRGADGVNIIKKSSGRVCREMTKQIHHDSARKRARKSRKSCFQRGAESNARRLAIAIHLARRRRKLLRQILKRRQAIAPLGSKQTRQPRWQICWRLDSAQDDSILLRG